MIAYTIRRLAWLLPTLFIVCCCLFFLLRILPGDPAVAMLGEYATDQAIADLRLKLGLNRPLYIQFYDYLRSVFSLDLGISLSTGMDNLDLILSVFPYTLELAVGATILSIIIALPIGILSALKRNTIIDAIGRVFALLGISIPVFFLAILLIMFFSLKLDLFPVQGVGNSNSIGSRLYHLFLPALSLGLLRAGSMMRLTRASMLDILSADYITTARSKGISEALVIHKHALRNALIPVVTAAGIEIAMTLGGTVITETIYSRPGIGRLLIGAVSARDYPLIQSIILLFVVIVFFSNLIVDLLYAYLDPRIKYE